MAWGDEEIVDGGYLGKSYIVHENYDGSKTIYEQGPMGGRGAEVGKEVYSKLYGYTKVSANGGSINVYNPSIYGPDLNTGSGVSRALRDASGNAPRSSSPTNQQSGNQSTRTSSSSYQGDTILDWLVEIVLHFPRVFRGIGMGLLMFILLFPILPFVILGHIFAAIIFYIFVPGIFDSWVWVVFSVIVFLFPFPLGFIFLEKSLDSK